MPQLPRTHHRSEKDLSLVPRRHGEQGAASTSLGVHNWIATPFGLAKTMDGGFLRSERLTHLHAALRLF